MRQSLTQVTLVCKRLKLRKGGKTFAEALTLAFWLRCGFTGRVASAAIEDCLKISKLLCVALLILIGESVAGAQSCEVHFFNGAGSNTPIWIASDGPGILFILPPGETVHRVNNFTLAHPGAPSFNVGNYAEVWFSIPPGGTNARLDRVATNWPIKPVWISNKVMVEFTNSLGTASVTFGTNALPVLTNLQSDKFAAIWLRLSLVLFCVVVGLLTFSCYQSGRRP